MSKKEENNEKEPLCKNKPYMVRVSGELKILVQKDIDSGKTAQCVLIEALRLKYHKDQNIY